MKRKSISKEMRIVVYNKYNHHCAYCGCELDLKEMQIDHLYPIHKGGSDILENYMPACRMCNFYKSTFELEDFRKRIYTLNNRLDKLFIYRLAKKYGLIKETKKPIEFYFEKRKKKKMKELTEQECSDALTRLLRPYFAQVAVQDVYHSINKNHSIEDDSNLLTLLILKYFPSIEAKKMFEELGYDQTSTGHVIVYKKNISEITKKVILFEPNNFTVFEEENVNGEVALHPSWITQEELIACIKQSKELGWKQ